MELSECPPAVASLKRELARRNIELEYCDTGAAARDLVLSRLPAGATVMNGGSATLEQIGVLDALRTGSYEYPRPKIYLIDDPVKRLAARRQATIADYFASSFSEER